MRRCLPGFVGVLSFLAGCGASGSKEDERPPVDSSAPDTRPLDGGADTTTVDSASDTTPETPGCETGTLCGGKCVDLLADPANCGGCGTSCGPTEVCQAGKCDTKCADGFSKCEGTCKNLKTDVTACGACGTTCKDGDICSAGLCSCAAGKTLCLGICKDLSTDRESCGTCGKTCATAEVCTKGVCGCATGDLVCKGVCTKVKIDAANCGACGKTCATGAGCLEGACTCDGGGLECSGICKAVKTDAANCGKCGLACATGGSCVDGTCTCPGVAGLACAGTCVDADADVNNCGSCGRTCGDVATCKTGSCVYGIGSDGVLVVTAPKILEIAMAVASGDVASNTVKISTISGPIAFAAGQVVLLHQTQSKTANVGQYEYATIVSVAGNVLTLGKKLRNTYVNDEFSHAQIVTVPQYTNVTISGAGKLTAPPWDGATGGILAMDVTGDLTVAGAISMDGLGFRGRRHACVYRCARGYQGEGTFGRGVPEIASNGNGGGGGGAGQDGAAGAGGGHAAPGGPGAFGACGTCSEGCPVPGGAQGLTVGVSALTSTFFFGGAGGEGGADEDGSNPGAGGSGGGAILVRATKVNVSGQISSDGLTGRDGEIVSVECGGTGCGMGGGGGGAGGTVRLVTNEAALGSGLVSAAGGGRGKSTCGASDGIGGGAGSVGRISVSSVKTTGTTAPTFDPN